MALALRNVAVWAATSFSLTIVGAKAADNPLDAPLVSQAPTLRSEIKRGYDAGEKCARDHTFALDPLQKCIEGAQADNRQKMGQGYEAFDTGCYFAAWKQFSLLVASNKGGVLVNDPLARSHEKLYWVEYRESRKKIGVTDDAVIEVVKIGGPIKAMMADAATRIGD